MSATTTALKVLEHVARHQPVGVSDISRALSVPKSTVQRALVDLAAEGWLEQEPEGTRRWVQTVKMLGIARHDGNRGLRRRAFPAMRALSARFDENVHLSVRSGANIFIIEKLESSKSVRPFDPVGIATPLHTTSTGKAILAWSPQDDIDEFLSKSLNSFPEQMQMDPESLRKEIGEIRKNGFSLNRGEWRPEIRSAAAPLFDAHGRASAAIAVAVPSHRITADELINLGKAVASTVESHMNTLNRPLAEGE